MPVQPAPECSIEDEACLCRNGIFATRGADRRRFLLASLPRVPASQPPGSLFHREQCLGVPEKCLPSRVSRAPREPRSSNRPPSPVARSRVHLSRWQVN